MSNKTFIESVVLGEAHIDDIDDWIDRWHEDRQIMPIYDFLGISWSEYALWVYDPSVIASIVDARREEIA